MNLALEVIIFNHDPTSSTRDALNIRRNETTPLLGPEWQTGVNSDFADSVSAYSIKDTQGHRITIKAKFATDDQKDQKVLVRALGAAKDDETTVGVLGNVVSRSIKLSGGESDLKVFKLEKVGLKAAGVGVHDMSWRWQFRTNNTDDWTDFQTTRHRVYSLLDTPQAPWKQKPFIASNTQVPWVDVLEHAARWAAGAKDVDQAAHLITGRVYELGSNLLSYDSSEFYVTWVFGNFNCTRFLERLAGGIGNGSHVNCTDCAAIVATFANALGCSLSESTMSEFNSNPILRIGESDFWSGTVGFHEVAWKGSCGVNDLVFDGCYNLDGDDEPSSPPHVPLLAASLRFGTQNDVAYRFRLMAASTARVSGVPQPEERQRRPVSSSDTATPLVFRNLSLLKAADDQFRSVAGFDNPNQTFAIARLAGMLDRLEGYRLQHTDKVQRPEVHLIEHTFGSQGDELQTLARIDQYECSSSGVVRDVLLKILAGFQVPILSPTSEVGDIGFKDERAHTVVFARHNFIYTVRNAGEHLRDLSALASILDKNIVPHV